MISIIIASISIITIIITTSIIMLKGVDIKKQYDDNLRIMTDQINNTQDYNKKIDQETISNITNVRTTYTTKEDIARTVNTRDLSAVNGSINNVTGDKLTYNTVNTRDLSAVNGSINNVTGENLTYNSIDFGPSILQKDANNMTMNMKNNGSFNFKDQNNNTNMSFQPNQGTINVTPDWSVGKQDIAANDIFGTDNNKFSINYDNKNVMGLYNSSEGNLLNIDDKNTSGFALTAGEADPIVLFNNQFISGMFAGTKAPFNVFSKEFNIMADNTNISNTAFSTDPDNVNANIVNDMSKEKKFMIYGNTSGSTDGSIKSIGLNDNVYVKGSMNSTDIVAKNSLSIGNNTAYMNSAGDIGASRNINVMGDIVANGGNNWIIHTPDDGKRSMHMAPSKTASQQDWDWTKETVFNPDGKVKTNKLQLGDKFQLSGVGEAHGDDGWLRVFNKDGTDYYGGVAAANLWSRDTTYLNGNTYANKINSTQGINVTNGDPGPLIEKKYGSDADRYGVGQWPNGTTRLYAATAYPGTVNLSLAKANNTFDDVVSVKPNRDVNINGNIVTPNSHVFYSKGRQHIHGEDNLYILNKNGVVIGKEWGGNGNLSVQGDANFNGNLNANNGLNIKNTFGLNKSGGSGWWNNMTQNGDAVIVNSADGSLGGKTLADQQNKNGITLAPHDGIGALRVHGGGVDINGTTNIYGNIVTPKDNLFYTKGRQHIHGEDNLYILNRNGVVIGKEWGGNGNLLVQGDTNTQGTINATGNIKTNGQLCINNTCISEANLKKVLAMP